MYATLFAKIQEILDTCNKIGAIYDFGLTAKAEKYPCVVVIHSGFDSEWISNEENLEGYKFKIHIYQETITNGKRNSYQGIFLPLLDQITDAFKSAWNGGTTMDGHRVWLKITSDDPDVIPTETGEVLHTSINLIINLATDI